MHEDSRDFFYRENPNRKNDIWCDLIMLRKLLQGWAMHSKMRFWCIITHKQSFADGFGYGKSDGFGYGKSAAHAQTVRFRVNLQNNNLF